MASVAEKIQLLDPELVEVRTQAIGRELMAEAKRAHAHFSVLNRWTEQVLSWCMSDPAVKTSVLRFIDVLPSLRSSRDVARHVREYFGRTASRLPPALRLGSSLARPGLLTAPALAAIVRQLVEHVAHQFIAESRPERVRHVIHELAAKGATCTLDILGEQVLSDAEADRYQALYETVLREAVAANDTLPGPVLSCGPRTNLSIKPSALTPRFDPIAPRQSSERAAARLLPIMQLAAQSGAAIHIDMEQYEVRDLTLHLVKYISTLPMAAIRPRLGVVIQTYLRDAEATLEDLLDWVAAREQPLTVRLVKGAYWDFEIAQAAQRSWEPPVFQDKDATDAAFERVTTRLLSAHPLVTTAIASHNLRSIAHAMALAEALGVAKDQIEFQLLYGMGEALHAAILARGYPVRIYTPIGELIPGMGYLVRRLLENTANESFLRQEFVSGASADVLLRRPRPGGSRQAPAVAVPKANAWRGEPPLDFSTAPARDRMAEALATARDQRGAYYPLQIGDRNVDTKEVAVVRNPADPADVLGSVAQAALPDVQDAVAVATAVQPRWAATPVSERVQLLRRAAALMRERRAAFAAWEILEVGKTWREADADVVEAIDYLEYYARQMEELGQGRPLAEVPGERNTYVYVPRGVAVVIAPWNFALAIPTGMISAALVTGNAVIFKAAEQSSIVGAQLVQLLREAGMPPEAVQYVPGKGETIGAALVAHADVAQILFTGSRAVGLEILGIAARVTAGQRTVKHVVTEMGGKNALIIDSDADLDAAVAGTLVSAFGYGGQKCSAAARLIVHEAIAERFLSRLGAAADRLVVGDPVDPDTDIGPLIEASAQQRLQDAVTVAAEVGRVIYRYPAVRTPPHGYFVGPCIVADIPPHHPLAREELFGPLPCVFRVSSFEDALALANDTDYALTGGIYSRSPEHVRLATQQFDVGNLYINRPITGAIVGRQPFGGHRLSGLGTKAGGPDYLLQLMLPKTICEDTRRHGMPLE